MRKACRLRPDLQLEIGFLKASSLYNLTEFHSRLQQARKHRERFDLMATSRLNAQSGSNKPFSFLLEIDMGSEDNPRFAREKVRPGIAYLEELKVCRRFGQPHGRYLVVTSGERRMLNMKAQTERNGGSGLFYFSTFADMDAESVLTHQSGFWPAMTKGAASSQCRCRLRLISPNLPARMAT